MSAEASQRLSEVRRRVAEAKGIVDRAIAATASARSYLDEVAAEVAGHVKKNQDAAALRAAALAQSLKLGRSTTFPEAPFVAVDYAARRSAEERLSVAEHVLDELMTEEHEAQEAIDKATADLHAAARAVIGTEVEIIVAKINDLEHQSMAARIQVEGAVRSGTLGWGRELGLSAPGKHLIASNQTLVIGTRNAPEFTASNESANAWRARYEGLITNHAARRIKILRL